MSTEHLFRLSRRGAWFVPLAAATFALPGCGSSSAHTSTASDGGGAAPDAKTATADATAREASTPPPLVDAASVQVPEGGNGNASGRCAIPAAAAPADVSSPTTVVGTGTAASCTAQSVVDAVHAGGVVTFNCGADPVTIAVPEIDIYNDGGKGDGSVTIDGGGKVTLSGSGTNRVLYQNTCDQALHWTTPHCQAQDTPHLVLQNIAFTGGSAAATSSVLGGGAVYVGGGTFRAYNVLFTGNTEPTIGQDYAGGAIYTFNQTAPVYLVNSTFSHNSGSNGGALGSIATSWTVLNSVFDQNKTLGNGENPAQPGTPGGGLGGAIYNDGNSYTLTVCGTLLTGNTAADLGSGSIFQVVDDLKGALDIEQSTFQGNSDTGAVQSASHPSIYVEAADKAGNAGVTITATTFN